jgi:hypothetical protein
MQFETRTLVVVALVVALVPGAIGALVWQTSKTYPGRWALGNLLAAATLFLFSLRGSAPDWISIVLANALALAGGIAFLQGIRAFRGLPIRWYPECLLGLFALVVVAYFRYVTDDINLRILAMSLALGSIGFASGVTLLKEMPRGRRVGFAVTGVVFVLGGVIHLVRGIYVIGFHPVRNLFEPSASNGVLFVAASLGIVAWSLGFILLTAERFNPAAELTDAGMGPTVPLALFNEAVAAGEVRQQLRKILDSDAFRRSARMERFLTLAVERTLLGHPDELKEYVLGRDVFNRGEDYDPRLDSIVRVEAQRLRRKLQEYYDSAGCDDPIIVEFPIGRYVPTFKYRQAPPTSVIQTKAAST